MPVEIRVPQLGESVVEATITRWLKKEGDAVAAGEAVVELETDKVNVEVPAEQDGVLQQITSRKARRSPSAPCWASIGETAMPPPSAAAQPPASVPPLPRRRRPDANGSGAW